MRVAIVEDDQGCRQQLEEYVHRYGREHGTEFEVESFADGRQIVAQEASCFDIILLDIEMPGLNGMEAAEQLRSRDEDVVLMFVTNMAQYAIRGYEVGALDFVLKPINHYTFSVRFERAIHRAQKREGSQVLLNLPDAVRLVDTRDIYYVEVQNRQLHYHTPGGEYVVRGTMQQAEQQLGPYHFVKCSHWYLVNLRHVTEVKRDTVMVAGQELEISRRNYTAFLTALTNYVGGGA